MRTNRRRIAIRSRALRVVFRAILCQLFSCLDFRHGAVCENWRFRTLTDRSMTQTKQAPEIFQRKIDELDLAGLPPRGSPGFDEALISRFALEYAGRGWNPASATKAMSLFCAKARRRCGMRRKARGPCLRRPCSTSTSCWAATPPESADVVRESFHGASPGRFGRACKPEPVSRIDASRPEPLVLVAPIGRFRSQAALQMTAPRDSRPAVFGRKGE